MPVHRLIIPAVVVALVTTGITIGQTPPAAASVQPAAPEPQRPAEIAAFKQARESGRPVEIEGQQTPNTAILANPDGQFTYRATARPERVQKNGKWRNIDTTLAKRDDGLYAPVASTADVAFSGGGTTALVTLSSRDKRLTLSWPAPLPAPRVAGSSATYPDVLPGVDLQVTATAHSYRKTLIVHDAEAAKNPALTAIAFDATATGLNLSSGTGGALNATDANGALVFVGSTPLMWDSRHEEGQPVPTADEPGNTTHVKLDITPTSANGARVVIKPVPAALTGKDVVYPAYIDPTTGDIGTSDWGDIGNNGFSDYRDTFARVGRCYQFSGCNANWVARSFFVMPTNALQARNGFAAVIRSATFTITNAHTGNSGCNDVRAMWTHHQFTSQTRWPGPGGVEAVDMSTKSACHAASVQFDAIAAANAAVSANASQITIGLKSADEGAQDKNHWNRFANNPAFAVRFAFPPGRATNTGLSRAVTCTGTAVVPDRHPTLHATAADNNVPPLNVLLYFQVWTADHGRQVAQSPGIQIASGSTAQWQVDTDLGTGSWAYRVSVQNGGGDGTGGLWNGGYSPWTTFETRGTPPRSAPVPSSDDYPEGYWGRGVGKFTFENQAGDNAAGFTYTFAGPGTQRIPNTGDCNYNQTFANGGWVAADPTGVAKDVPIVPANLSPGYHTLHIRTFDDAHNVSANEWDYPFFVAPNYGIPTRIEAGDPTQINVTQPGGQGSTLTQHPTHIYFDGTAKGQSFSITFTAPVEADYALGLVKSSWNDVRVTVDDVAKPNIPWYMSYGELGGMHLTPGRHVITLTTTDEPAEAARTRKNHFASASEQNPYYISVDAVDVIPLNNVTTGSFSEAMNNDGISNDGVSFPFEKSLDLVGSSLSAQTMAAAGLAPGSTVTVNGATFTLHAPNSAGNDNVIATGQTIPLPANQQIPSSAIGMLVASTCSDTPPTPAGIVYTDGTVDKPTMNAVSDWAITSTNVITPMVTLPYRNTGATKDLTNRPSVYAAFIPANPLKTPQKITLPNLGTSFRTHCWERSLHILSIAPRPVTPPDGKTWAGAWAAPADSAAAPPNGFADKTLRIVAHPAITGGETRIRLSNTGSPTPVTIDAATIAAQTAGAATKDAPVTLKFNNSTTVTIPAGGDVYSDAVTMPATTGASGSLTVSLHLPNTVTTAPVHTANGSVTYLAPGNATTNQDGAAFQTTMPSNFYLSAIDVTTAPDNGTLAILADQNTSAPGTDPAAHPNWGDTLATQLGPDLPGGLITTTHTNTPPPGWWTALNQTTLAGPRLRTVVVTLGAQDILRSDTPQTIQNKLTELISDINGFNRYKRPNGARIHVILATVPPLGLDPNSPQEKNRQQLNTDITNRYNQYGANELLSLDQAVRDPTQPSNINPPYLTGGTPNDAYYQRIAQTFKTAVDNGTITP
jgi:hypothetical protein